jgi:uncharacterized membrane protein (UPF0127 family)
VRNLPVGRALAFVLVTALCAAPVASCSASGAALPHLPTGTLRVRTASETVTLDVQIAESEPARALGLMHRRSLAPNSGMAFLYPGPTGRSFWMKDTLIPLSIAFWGTDHRIVDILDMTPCRADPCPLYSPRASYVGAVEANQGFFTSHGISVGDEVQLSQARRCAPGPGPHPSCATQSYH